MPLHGNCKLTKARAAPSAKWGQTDIFCVKCLQYIYFSSYGRT